MFLLVDAHRRLDVGMLVDGQRAPSHGDVLHWPQHLTPAASPPVPSSPKHIEQKRPRLLIGRVYESIQSRKFIKRPERGILAQGYVCFVF
jgi:hypothetical protein